MEAFDDYRTDSTYAINYTEGLSPELMRLSLLLQGVDMPAPEPGQPFRYLELGFGLGLSLNIHAAVRGGEFWGTDFLPQHAERARVTSETAGNNCVILNKSFAELDEMSADGKLPQFDAVAFHGIWSWINIENRTHILNILRRNLRSGGVAYISYNTQPGWSFFMPVRELMVQNVERLGEDVDIHERIKTTLDYVNSLGEAGAAFFKNNPQSMAFLRHIKKYPVNYLAQEYFNRSWQPFYFREVAEDLASVGCGFVSSTNLTSQTGALVPPQTRGLLGQTVNPFTRETLRDFAMNQRFRSDLFVRDVKRMTSKEQMAKLGETCLMLAADAGNVNLSLKTSYGDVNLEPHIYAPIIAALSEGGIGPKRIGDIESAVGSNRRLLVECVSILVGQRIATPAIKDPDVSRVEASHRLNRELCRQASLGDDMQCLASPVTGGGVRLTHTEQLFLHFRPSGEPNAEAWARDVLNNMVERGNQRIDYQKAVADVTAVLTKFLSERMQYLRDRNVVF